MDAIWLNISGSFSQMLGWELVAVILAIAYLWLAIRESLWCWPAAFISTFIYTILFWKVSLLMDSMLNVFYMVMAVYGWWAWRQGGQRHEGVEVHRWPLLWHAYAVFGILVASLISGSLLTQYSEAAWPFLDSFTTWASVFTTFLVTRKILENWLYWIVIDSVAIMLYIDRELYLTAALFAAYLVMCVFGYRQWRSREQNNGFA